ncbi:ABC transporter permease [Cohnella xylanilytica]|uniref:ABC transporter permease n=1 Tax=Cohnella xylanilytica TaxID=557555 RepID=A0A841U6N4_9BACL|nr:ABC transporter permease [Cohnella xylanilytica]MBB6693691.1 ABC transporter permease [Cohnella xylanilytica]GIO15204.1 ABC transporter permease [Cohnella xylanilytica]
MLAYTGKRLVSLVPILIVVAVVVFFVMHLTPGDPAAVMLGTEASQADIAQLRHQLGLDEPVLAQFVDWLGGVARGDLGTSIFMKMPVSQAIAEHVGPTLSLSILAQLVAAVLALPLGILAAKKRGTATDQMVMGVSLLGISLPSFLLGLFLMLVFAVELRWFPVSGYKPLADGFLEHLRYLVLPALALGSMQAALIARMTRASMLEVLNQGYIEIARAKGLREISVVFKHALRNAFIPIVTVVGQSFALLIGGATVTETVFNIPGLGQLIVNAVERRDYEVIQGVVLVIAALYVVLNLIVDLLYGLIDPRIRHKR